MSKTNFYKDRKSSMENREILNWTPYGRSPIKIFSPNRWERRPQLNNLDNLDNLDNLENPSTLSNNINIIDKKTPIIITCLDLLNMNNFEIK